MARVLLIAVFASLFLAAGVAQGATVPPAVVSESVSHVTGTDATLEAALESGDATAGAYYQFQFSELPAEFPDELNCPPPPSSGPFLPCNGPESSTALPIGHIAAGDGPVPVALDLADAGVTLEPGTTYYFRIVVAPAKQSEDTIEWEEPVVGGGERSFTTAAAGIPCPPPVTGGSTGAESPPVSGGGSGGPSAVPAPVVQPRHHGRHHRRHARHRHHGRAVGLTRIAR